MMNDSEILTVAADVIRIEHQSIGRLEEQLMPDLVAAIRAIMQSGGRVVVSGIGKSAIIAQKMVATFNSTGTPSVFLHAADAIHGDLGIIQQNDVAILLSKSGESPEIKVLVPLIRNFGNTIIAITGNSQSFLAKQADHVLNSFVETEACPNNLAPTSSTTAQMVVGDVLAVCLLKLRGFQASDFARFHPGGALGKQLYLKVCDLSQLHEKPAVKPDTVITEVIMEISGKRLGATAVLNEAREVLGIVTDGDLRRMIEKHSRFQDLKAADVMNPSPRCVEASALAIDALTLMRSANISQLIVLNEGKYDGIIHLHDLIREGLV